MPSNLNKELVQKKWFSNFISLLRNEISIRSSLILFYLLLISFVSITIIVVNQQIINRVLVNLTKRIMKDTGDIIQRQIDDYLEPFTYDLNEAVNLISENIIVPSTDFKFTRYLLERVKVDPQVYSAYWATTNGNFFALKRESFNQYQIWHIERSKKPPEITFSTMNDQGKIEDITSQPNETFDPRIRPWYQAAIKEKTTIWTNIYQFTLFHQHGVSPYGITAAKAVYDKNNTLLGVFGMDITIEQLIDFIKKIRASEHSIILVTDKDNYLIAAEGDPTLEQSVGEKITPEFLKGLKTSYPLESFFYKDIVYGKVYKFNAKDKYFIIQKDLKFGIGNDWKVIIVVPEKDILGQLRVAGLISLLSALVVLILGILIANAISQRITKPIKQIVAEAEAIQKFELEKIIDIPSLMKEIRILTAAFITMKTGLQSFERYVPIHLIKKLFASGKIAEVGGETKNITILFSDIHNFTPLIESLPPEQVMKILYEYLDAMTKIVLKLQGTVDKYVGDMVMAFWGAPLEDEYQADHACVTALQMLQTLKELNLKWSKEHSEPISIRISVNTGAAIVGNVGSSERLNYTALGDSVNLASRLEEANKLYGTRIIITENTVRSLKSSFPIRLLDRVMVRGKREDVKIYELSPENFDSAELLEYNKKFADAFEYYQQGNWNDALNLFYELWQRFTHDQITKLYIHRCELLIKHKPLYWDGIWRLD